MVVGAVKFGFEGQRQEIRKDRQMIIPAQVMPLFLSFFSDQSVVNTPDFSVGFGKAPKLS